MAIAHGCQPANNGASFLDSSYSGISGCSAGQRNRDIELANVKLYSVPDTLCKSEAEEAVGNGGGAKTNINACVYDNDGARIGFPIVSKS